MMKNGLRLLGLTAAVLMANTVSAQSNDEIMLQRIEDLETQLRELRAQMESRDEIVEVAAETAEVALQEVEALSVMGSGNKSGVSIGGYGELHYNNLDSGKEIDFHRFVLFFGNEFTDRLRFFSEVELEHSLAGDGKPGEVELEQAYIEYDLSATLSAKGGLFLLPVGILNETHEPPTFMGVERNKIESEIIPSTWWEAGAGLSGSSASGFSWDLALHSGLNVPVTGSNAYRIRSGRQKVAEASAEDLAATGRIRYTAFDGLELSMSLQHQSDITQGADDASALLVEAHAVYQNGPLGLRALYARWDIDSDIAQTLGKDKQSGFYFEPSWALNEDWRVYTRYGSYNTADNLPGSEDRKQLDFGANWYLHEDVVVKFDWQNQQGAGDDDGFNIGVGYQF